MCRAHGMTVQVERVRKTSWLNSERNRALKCGERLENLES